MLCLICGEQGLVDALLNVALFVPYGFALSLLGFSKRRIVWVAGLTSLGIEMLQWGVITGRHPQLRDVLMNGAGGALGALLADHRRVFLRPSPHAARRLACLGAVVWMLQLGLVAWGLAPSPPQANRRYWVQWTHVFPDTWPFRGSINDVELNGVPIRDGPLTDVHAIGEELSRGSIVLNVIATGGLPPAGQSQVVAIANDAYRVGVRLQQDRCDFEFKVRLRSADIGLNYPAVKLADRCRTDPAGGLVLSGRVDARGLRLTARDEEGLEENRLLFTPNLGWSFFHPFDLAYVDPWLPTAAWIASFLFVVAYWAGHSSRPRPMAVGLVATVTAGFLGIPVLFGFQPVSWGEWVAAAAGVLAGIVVGEFARRSLRAVTGGAPQ
jgi:hypothetical protein